MLLVGRLLRAKYFPTSEWLSAREGGKPSLIWRSLIWRKEILELVMRWRVGNGLFINVKSDKWLPQPTTFKVISPDASLWNLKVSDCIDENKQWKVPFIQSKILDFEVRSILSISLPKNNSVDKLI